MGLSGSEHRKVKQLVNELKIQWKLLEFKQVLSINRKTARLYPPGPLDSASVSDSGWFSTEQERRG